MPSKDAGERREGCGKRCKLEVPGLVRGAM